MSNMNDYHFHKDCKYFSECTEEIVKDGRHEVIKFTCPVGGVGHYYKGDLHTIKWDLPCFEPYQESLQFES